MKTDDTQFDNISAMVDGELSNAQWASTLAKLGESDNQAGKKTWEVYHQIGDVLRSDDLAVTLSPDFSARFSALLDAEPVILAPKFTQPADAQAVAQIAISNSPRVARYVAMTSMAVAAAVAFFMAPQIIPLLNPSSGSDVFMSRMEQQNKVQANGVQLASSVNVPEAQYRAGEQVDMLRDPRLDSYLMAHQKFSPSIGNGTHYVTRANVVSAAPTASEK